MKRLIGIIVVVVLIGLGAAYFTSPMSPVDWSGASNPGDSSENNGEETPEEVVPVTAAGSRVVADARLVPAQDASLSLPISGIVSEVLVDEGDIVEADQILLKLDDSQQRTAVVRSQAELQRAKARLDELVAGPRAQEIQSAEAALTAAQAQLTRIESGSLPGEIAAAEAAVDSSRASLQKVMEGAADEQLIAARAEMANAEAEMIRAQRAYDKVKWRNDVGALPESATLQQATNTFTAAQAKLADLEAGATPADVSGASAEVRRAEAQLETLAAVLPQDVAAAQAEVERAQAQLELLKAGTRQEEIDSARADVAAATANLQQALIALADIELTSPFTGTVALLDLEPGEQVAAGAIAAQIADLSSWEVLTEDLTEFDIVGVGPGDSVSLTFDAIPSLELTGTVDRVRPIGTDRRGDIVYTVVVIPDSNDERLLWNMTSVVTFDKDQ